MAKIRNKSLLSFGISMIIFILFILFNIESCLGGTLTEKINTYDIFDKNELLEETELNLTFFFGYVSNVTLFEDFIKFNAQNLFYVIFQPYHYGKITSEEEIIAKQVFGLTLNVEPNIVIGFYKTSL